MPCCDRSARRTPRSPEVISSNREHLDRYHPGPFLEHRLAGGVICWFIDRRNRLAELGYWLDRRLVGRGWATRGAAAVIDRLFEGECLHRIEMQSGVSNLANRAVPERLGFQL